MFGFSLSFQDWCIFIGTVATVILVVYAALERHIPKGRAPVAKPQRSGRASQADPAPTSRRLTIPIILAAVAWIAVAADFTDRHWISGRGTVPLSARTEAPAAPSMPAPPLSMSPAPQAAPRIIVDVTPEYLMDLYKDRMTVQGDALFAPPCARPPPADRGALCRQGRGTTSASRKRTGSARGSPARLHRRDGVWAGLRPFPHNQLSILWCFPTRRRRRGPSA